MSYLDTLNSTQKANAATLLDRMKAKGITNPYSQAAILAIVSKESEFIPRVEGTYKNTSNSRIRAIFGSRVSSLNETQLTNLKSNDKDFYNLVYKSTAGNKGGDDGYNYRGRGFNQLTGRGNYETFGKKIGVDLLKYPDKANNVSTAADIVIEYFKTSIAILKSKGKLAAYNSEDINGFKNVSDAVGAFYHANAGVGLSVDSVKNDSTGGRKKAFDRSEELLKQIGESGGVQLFFLRRVWSNKYGKIAIITVGLGAIIGTAYLIIENKKTE